MTLAIVLGAVGLVAYAITLDTCREIYHKALQEDALDRPLSKAWRAPAD